MTLAEAYQLLGLSVGADGAAIKAAYRRLSKEAHPDNLGPRASEAERTAANERMVRLNGAMQRLKDIESSDDAAEAARAEQARALWGEIARLLGSEDIVSALQTYLRLCGLVIRFDGTLRAQGSRPGSVRNLERESLNEKKLCDDFSLFVAKEIKAKVARGKVQAAIRKALREAKVSRRKEIMSPLLRPYRAEEARPQWQRVGDLFDGNDPELDAAIIRKFYFDVKRKSVGLPVTNHLVPVFISGQGGGKTTLALKVLEPLDDLATPPVRLSDVIDPRSGDIFDYAAVLVDDIHEIAKGRVPELNSVVTAEWLNSRVLGTSTSLNREQRATFIATSNYPMSEIVPDSTGNRRWGELRLRNGNVLKGGDPDVWPTINDIDWSLLAQSVDHRGEDPINAVYDRLVARQSEGRKLSEVEEWALSVDFDDRRMAAILTPQGYKALPLFRLFAEMTGSTMTNTAFGRAMNAGVNHSTFPFGPGKATNAGKVYPRRLVRTTRLLLVA